MRHLLIRLVINATALFVAVRLIPGMHFTGGVGKLLLVALVFGLVNAVVRPVLTLLSCPLIVVTLGLFLLVINALMLGLTSWLSTRLDLGFQVDGFGPALVGGLVIGLISTVLTLFVGRAAQT
ncbi:MAG TPA: phage holin family protein [Gemmatimonadales bacterium]|jgi:putative membrane protein|nr:phage holin family protein [Gemmatimonadales bacterium]